MTTHPSKEGPTGIGKAKALAVSLLMLAAAMAAYLVPTAPPAHAADTFTVERTIDTPDVNVGDGDCDVTLAATGFQCTLRAAIQEANVTPEADLIRFAILDGGTGVQTIEVGKAGFGALPTIAHPVIIDGYTQPGASPNTKAVGNDAVLKIELNGASVGGDGLVLSSTSNSVIKGLVINRFGGGITMVGDSAANRIEGNFLGTDPTGSIDRGNSDDGVNLVNGPSENVVGGTNPAARNVISGNACNAVFVAGATGNRIEGNYIGTDNTGTKALANGDLGCAAIAIQAGSFGNTVGGATAGARNVVSGNKEDGVFLGSSSSTRVLGNRIGTAANGTGALGNSSVGAFIGGSNNSMGDGTAAGSNTVAFNGEEGVEISSGTGHAISRNSVFSNGGLGIDLLGGLEDAAGNTANDPGDVDSGANGLQNKPVLTSAKTVSGKTTIAGKLASVPNLSYLVQFYSNPSGNEGKKFIGQKIVTTAPSGDASFTFSPAASVAVGQTVTATASARNGDTSEFSAPKTIALSSGSVLAPDTLKVQGPSAVIKSPTAHFKFDSPDPDATFECSLDGEAYYGCSSPENVYRLPEGRHSFVVKTLNGEGNVDPSPALWAWTVDRNNK